MCSNKCSGCSGCTRGLRTTARGRLLDSHPPPGCLPLRKPSQRVTSGLREGGSGLESESGSVPEPRVAPADGRNVRTPGKNENRALRLPYEWTRKELPGRVRGTHRTGGGTSAKPREKANLQRTRSHLMDSGSTSTTTEVAEAQSKGLFLSGTFLPSRHLTEPLPTELQAGI